MYKTKKFAKALYIVSLVCFYGCLLSIVFLYGASEMLNSHNETMGYPISVNVRSEVSDSIISYKKGNRERIHSINQLNLHRQRTYDVMEDDSYEKALIVQRMAIYDDKGKDMASQFTKTFSPYNHSRGEIYIAPKDKALSTVLAIRHYMAYLLAAFIFWHISRFFKALGKDFSFNANLKARLKRIAITLIAYQLIMLILSFVIMHYLPKAETLTSVPNISKGEIVTMTYRTYAEYDLQIIFFALGLLCIAQLLGYGQKLQNENDLTI